jgi:hypothetical protein
VVGAGPIRTCAIGRPTIVGGATVGPVARASWIGAGCVAPVRSAGRRALALRTITLRAAVLPLRTITLRTAVLPLRTITLGTITLRAATLGTITLGTITLRTAVLPLRTITLRTATLGAATLRTITLRTPVLPLRTITRGSRSAPARTGSTRTGRPLESPSSTLPGTFVTGRDVLVPVTARPALAATLSRVAPLGAAASRSEAARTSGTATVIPAARPASRGSGPT